ncbi:hypothetical protein PGTUg99_020954 [Puccinia graminis f. sp. tritici]|uniref:Uncharacterized protein n=1 Tax=Puccinia graminis f. sp. tritici TaxID=56615 RepID=A0A5B0Q106_PUCGR|nr:hypothetical protein PGTUg99_020954 [Puccinia graminis f. sp. tritici]
MARWNDCLESVQQGVRVERWDDRCTSTKHRRDKIKTLTNWSNNNIKSNGHDRANQTLFRKRSGLRGIGRSSSAIVRRKIVYEERNLKSQRSRSKIPGPFPLCPLSLRKLV